MEKGCLQQHHDANTSCRVSELATNVGDQSHAGVIADTVETLNDCRSSSSAAEPQASNSTESSSRAPINMKDTATGAGDSKISVSAITVEQLSSNVESIALKDANKSHPAASNEKQQATIVGDSRKATTLLKPKLLHTDWGSLEVSVHKCPKQIRRDCQLVFTDSLSKYSEEERIAFMDRLLIIPTTQHASLDLSNYGNDVAEEKDRLLENFVEWADKMTVDLTNLGYWAEYCDPCSGLPMKSDGNVVYAEVQGLCLLRGYPTMNVGTCKVVLHPSWGASVYPASMFTDAPGEVLLELIHKSSNHSEAR